MADKEKENLHAGHRERLKERFREGGLESFNEHQVLELLLFYAIPRKDTNEMAHRLIKHFGSLPEVLDAPVQELCTVEGIGAHAASLIHFSGELVKRYHVEKQSNVKAFAGIDAVGEYLKPQFMNEANEKAIVVCLNNRWELRGCETLSKGTLTATDARAREIIEIAFRHKATSIVLAHSHPSGFAVPSSQDIETTRRLVYSLQLVELQLMDHLIFSHDEFVSMRQTPSIAPLFSDMSRRSIQK